MINTVLKIVMDIITGVVKSLEDSIEDLKHQVQVLQNDVLCLKQEIRQDIRLRQGVTELPV